MAIDRNDAFEIRETGVLLENGAHLSSGSASPTHTGLAGDIYFKTSDSTLWTLLANGSSWVLFINGSAIVYPIKYAYNGNASSGRWLEVFPGIASNDAPAPVILPSKITYVFLETENTGGAFTVAFYENSNQVTPVFSVTLNDGQSKNTFVLSSAFSAGQSVSMKVTSGSRNKPRGLFFFNTGNIA